MTLYDYKCDACGLSFEQNHPMSAPPVRVCPECGVEKVRKVLSTGGIQMSSGAKGGGDGAAMPPPCATGGCGMGGGGMCGI